MSVISIVSPCTHRGAVDVDSVFEGEVEIDVGGDLVVAARRKSQRRHEKEQKDEILFLILRVLKRFLKKESCVAEHQLAVGHIDGDGVRAVDLTGQDVLRQLIEHPDGVMARFTGRAPNSGS